MASCGTTDIIKTLVFIEHTDSFSIIHKNSQI